MTCYECFTGYALQTSNNSCVLCYIPNCAIVITVNGSCYCSVCNFVTGYVSDLSGGCDLCSNYLTNCFQCPNQTYCATCDPTLNFFTNASGLC